MSWSAKAPLLLMYLLAIAVKPDPGHAEENTRGVRWLDGSQQSTAPSTAGSEQPPSGNQPTPPAVNATPATTPAVEPVNPILQGLPAPTKTDVPMQASPIGATPLVNPAELSVVIQSGPSVQVGSRVSFQITSRKTGYVVLIDVDPVGKLTQIYPNALGMLRRPQPNGNKIKAHVPLVVPTAADMSTGFEFVAEPPVGNAIIVAVLSERPVHVLDLPELPPDVRTQAAAVDFLAKWVNELRVPEPNGRLGEVKWSLSVLPYSIQ